MTGTIDLNPSVFGFMDEVRHTLEVALQQEETEGDGFIARALEHDSNKTRAEILLPNGDFLILGLLRRT